MSNVLGTVNDVRLLADAAHAAGATVLVDAAQAVPHGSVDVQAWDADFVGFTGHKMLGPSGIGGFWARPELLEAMPPFLGGGEMILDVRKDGYVPNEVPWKFEAGTMPIAEATGLAAAIDYLEALGMDAVREHERRLTSTPCARCATASAIGSTSTGPAAPTCAAGSSPSGSTTSTPTTSRRCSTKTPSACARATTVPSR